MALHLEGLADATKVFSEVLWARDPQLWPLEPVETGHFEAVPWVVQYELVEVLAHASAAPTP